MSLSIHQIVEETRSLPPHMVAEVVDRILLAMHEGQTPDHTQAWAQTVHKRIDDIRSGSVEGIPSETTAAKIRRIVGGNCA